MQPANDEISPPSSFAAWAGRIAEAWRAAADGPSPLRIDRVRLLGTHNSYHVAPGPFAKGLVAAAAPLIRASTAPRSGGSVTPRRASS